MATYWVGYVEGQSARAANGAEWFLAPSRSLLAIDAVSRVDAYIAAHQELARDGRDVTVLADGKPPLGFTPQEVERISVAGVPLIAGYPRAGFQIEQIVRTTSAPGSERAKVELDDLPEVSLSSSEDEVYGSWVIFYTWERTETHSICFTLTEQDVSGLVGQDREAAIREGRAFNIEEARRRAADYIMPREFYKYVKPEEVGASAHTL